MFKYLLAISVILSFNVRANDTEEFTLIMEGAYTSGHTCFVLNYREEGNPSLGEGAFKRVHGDYTETIINYEIADCQVKMFSLPKIYKYCFLDGFTARTDGDLVECSISETKPYFKFQAQLSKSINDPVGGNQFITCNYKCIKKSWFEQLW